MDFHITELKQHITVKHKKCDIQQNNNKNYIIICTLQKFGVLKYYCVRSSKRYMLGILYKVCHNEIQSKVFTG